VVLPAPAIANQLLSWLAPAAALPASKEVRHGSR